MSENSKRLNIELPEEQVVEPKEDKKPETTEEHKEVVVDKTDIKKEDVLDEDAITLKRLNSKYNTDYKTLDEALDAIRKPATQEDEESKRRKREDDKLKFALEQGKFSQKKFEQFLVEKNKDPRSIVFKDYYEKMKAKGVSDDKIEKRFAALYGENIEDEEDEDLMEVREQRQKDLQKEAAKIIKRSFPEIYSLDKEFDDYQNGLKAEQTKAQQLQQNKTTYISDLNNFLSSKKAYAISIGDKDKPESEFKTTFEYPEEVINQLKAEFTDSKVLDKIIANYDKGTLETLLNYRLNELTQQGIIAHAARKYYSEQEEKRTKDRKALVPEVKIAGGTQVAFTGVNAERLGLKNEIAGQN